MGGDRGGSSVGFILTHALIFGRLATQMTRLGAGGHLFLRSINIGHRAGPILVESPLSEACH